MYCPNCGQQNNQGTNFCPKCGNHLSIAANAITAPTYIQAQTSESVTQLYAGFWKRFAAMILDWLVLLIPALLIGAVIGFMVGVGPEGSNTSSAEASGNLAVFLLTWLYFALMESSEKQATVGKMALGIKVVDQQGNRISFGRASGRYFGKIISGITLLIGYLMAAFTKQKQALHDMMASCLVVPKAVTSDELQQASHAKKMSKGAIFALVIFGSLVPVVGILAAVAIPAYQDYTVKAKTSEVVFIADQAAKAVEAYVIQNGTIPQQMEQTTFSTSSKYIKHVSVNGQNGVVQVIASFSPIMDKMLIFVPSRDQNNKIVWKCVSEEIPSKYLPQQCR